MKPKSLIVASAVISAAAVQACGGGSTSAPPPTSQPSSPLRCVHTFSAAEEQLSLARAGTLGLHQPNMESDEIMSDKLAVRFGGTQLSQQAFSALARLGARQLTEMNPQGSVTFDLPSGTDPVLAANSLRDLPGVVAAGPIVMRNLLTIPNDPLFNNVNQWDLYALDMPNAWGVTLGKTTIRIAIIDTGYDTLNPDLAGKVAASIVYDQGNGVAHTGASIEDTDGHGSDVSGIAAADTNNGTDVAGIGWSIRLLEARVFPKSNNCKNGTEKCASTQDIAAAINWAMSKGAKVINLSLGSTKPDQTYEEPAVAAAIAAGVVVVAAAGNNGAASIDYPAADAGVIAVGASAYCDSAKNVPGSGYEYVAKYSNYGPGLTLVAPGGDPDRAQSKCTTQACIDFLQWIENLDSTKGPFTEQVGLFAGTSQATPHVAGAVALMFAKDSGLTPSLAVKYLRMSADSIGDPRQGAGRLNVFNALNDTP